MGSRVFISHAAADRGLAHRVAEAAQKFGSQVWLDEWSLPQGASLASRINAALKDSDVVVAIVSKQSAQSPWLNWELGAALALDKKILIVTDADNLSERDLPPTLRSLVRVRPQQVERYLRQLELDLQPEGVAV